MEVSRSSYSSERRYEETRYDNVPVYQAQSSSTSAYHVDKNVDTSSKHEVQRHISEASSAGYSDSSATSKASGYHRKGKKDKSKKKGKSDGLTSRVEGRTALKGRQKSRDSGQYDVRQVFSKGMPITMQTAPPGASARDLETDSMASDRSERSWKLGRRKQPAVDHSQLRMSKSTPNLAAEETTRKHASRTTQISRSHGPVASKTRSQSAGRHVSYLTDSAPDVSTVQAKKRYKGRKKEWGLQTEAARIVDDVINNALDFLYGSSGKSHRSRHVSRTNDVRTEQTSSSVGRGLMSQKQGQVASFSNIRAAERSQNHKEHKVIVSGSMPNLITSKTQIAAAKASDNVDTRRQNHKTLNMRLGYDRNYGSSGYQSPGSTANRSSPKYKESFSSTYSTGQWSSVSSPRSLVPRQYNSGRTNPTDVQPSRPTIYSSDSEYSTTVEIRSRYNSDREQTSAHPATRKELPLSEPETLYRSPRKQTNDRRAKVNPPTLTKGNITKVFCGSNESRTSGVQKDDVSSPVVSAVRSLDDQMSPPVERRGVSGISDTYYDSGLSGTPTMHTRFTHIHSGQHLPETPAGLLSIGPISTTTVSSSDVTGVQSPAYDSVPLHLDLNKLSPRQQKTSSALLSGEGTALDVLNSPEGVLPTIDEVDESRYAAFSNEPMIVTDLLTGKSGRVPSSEQREYTIHDNLYGTENAIRMNTKQNLNLYIFNRRKDEGVSPTAELSDQEPDDQMSYCPDVVDYRLGRETELQQHKILHKQTQTLASEPTSPRRKKKSRSLVVHRVESPSRVVYRDTTHYITKEREIEKLPPQKADCADMCIQTEDPEDSGEEDLVSEHASEVDYGWEQHTEVPLSKLANQDRNISEVYVTHTIPKPIISESRQMESVIEYRTPPAPEPSGKDIPVVREQSENFFEKMDREWKKQQEQSQPPAPAAEPEQESEEEILETTVVEEKEQRIAMAIYEEVEFSAQRKEGGDLVDVDNPVPAFWLPNRYEGVMERKRQKKTQVTNIDKEGNRSRSSFGPNVPALEGDASLVQPPADFKPKVMADMTVESSKRTYRSDQSTNQNRDPTQPGQKHTLRADQPTKEHQTRASQKSSSHNSKTKDIPVRTSRKTSETVSTSGSLPRQRISLPIVSRRSRPFSPSEDKLPEDLAHFDKVVEELERELPKRPQTRPKPSARQIMIHKAKDAGRESSIKRSPKPKVSEEATGRRVSKSDPENVSFKSPDGVDLMAKMEESQREITMSADETDKSILSFDHPLRAIDGCVVQAEQSEPKIETKYIKDADGNTLKVTELSHTLRKCLEYEDHPKPPPSSSSAAALEEQMHEGSYIDMNLLETINSDADNYQDSDTSEDGSCVSVVAAKPQHKVIPEVTAETTTLLRPVQFDVQQTTLKLNDEASLPEQRHLIFDSRSRSGDQKDEIYPYETMTTAL